jgi:Zn-dependent protease
MSQGSVSAGVSEKPDQQSAVFDDTGTRKRARKLLSGTAIATGVLVLKLKALVVFLAAQFRVFLVNPFEGFGVAQMLVTGGSMLVSFVAYALKWQWQLAIGIVVVLFVHELGHAVVIRARGLRAGAMVFIPFIGGAVTLRRYPRSVFVDAQIGLAGPIAGTIASFFCLWIYRILGPGGGHELYLVIANVGFVLNLFNLTPVRPLDGGRIAAAITKWMWVFGALIVFGLMVLLRNPLLVVLFLVAVAQIWGAIRREQIKRFYAITPRKRVGVAVVYFSLVAVLAWASIATHAMLR